MGLSSVVFVGHDDGGLLALKATERIQASPDSSEVNICSNLLTINYFVLKYERKIRNLFDYKS